MNDLKMVAIEAATEAGTLLMNEIGKIQIAGSSYGNTLVLKTKQDNASELLIVERLKRSFPEHNFLAEELTQIDSSSEYTWIIDPIDGTNNYLDGRDTFSVSIGLEYKGDIVLGVVYLPKRDELFVAEKGKGAFCNDLPIHMSDHSALLDADITFSTFPGYEKETAYLRERIVKAIPRHRDFGFSDPNQVDPLFGRGSMAAEFCYLACGRIDGLIRLKQKPWDVAGGSLIASEAGAVMMNLKGEKPNIWEGDYIAANKILLDELKKILL